MLQTNGDEENPFQPSSSIIRTPTKPNDGDKCVICNTEDGPGDEPTVNWILCDSCKKWFHVNCVTNPAETCSSDYVCDNCLQLLKPVNEGSKTRSAAHSSNKSARKTNSECSLVRRQQIALELKQLEIETELKRKQLEEEIQEEKRIQLEEENARIKALQEAEEARHRAYERQKQLRDKIREAELNCVRRQTKLIQEQLMESENDTNSEMSSNPSSILKVTAWRNKNCQTTDVNKEKTTTLHHPAQIDHVRLQSKRTTSEDKVINDKKLQPQTIKFEQPKFSEPNYYEDDKQHQPEDQLSEVPKNTINQFSLTSQHLLARKGLQTELPIFYGRAEEWIIFINTYETTTKACGFNDLENLVRLKKCLKDKALRAVEDMLVSPENVPDIIETLRVYFGHPRTIISTLLNKVKKFPLIKIEDYDALIEFSFAVRNLHSTIIASGLTSHLSDPTLINELVTKLDSVTRIKWFEFKSKYSEDTLTTFKTWISEYAKNFIGQPTLAKSYSGYNKPKISQPEFNRKKFVNVHQETSSNPKQSASSDNTPNKNYKCVACNGSCKSLTECKTFNNQSVADRLVVARKAKVCRRCLTSGHWYLRCKKVCGKGGCTLNHHALLHEDSKSDTLKPVEITTPSDAPNYGQIYMHDKENSVLFQFLPVRMYYNQKEVTACAFFDTGSSITLIEEDIAQELGLNGVPSPLILKWTADSHRTEEDSKLVTFNISSTNKSSKKFTITNARTVKQLKLPAQSVNPTVLQQTYKHLRGIPLEPIEMARPQILIGLDNEFLINPLKCVEGKPGQPTAIKTRLGWTVSGSVVKNQPDVSIKMVNAHYQLTPDENLHKLVGQFYAIDSLGTSASHSLMSSDEIRARNIMEATTIRKGDFFETGLLWKYDQVDLPNSLPVAKKRFELLEKKMILDPELGNKLRTMVKDYVSKKYARKLTAEELAQQHPNTWYLPVFPVFNPHKPNKIRLVWDAASAINGISLNTVLLSGPDQLSSLLSVLYQFRQRRIAISADICEMFHRIRIRPQDQHAQRFLWKDEPDSDVDVYVLEVMTFGSTCSPSSAQFIKNKNALEFADQYPEAVKCITDNHYVDDLLYSVDSEEDAIKLANDIRLVHSKGGFHIRHWKSNSPDVIRAIGETDDQQNQELKIDPSDTTSKVLGMWWCTRTDTFQYKISNNEKNKSILSGDQIPTKRELLRIVMSLFDPLGLISHYLIYAKIILQDVWRSEIEWDEQLTQEQFQKWYRWIQLLPEVEQIKIPRCYLRILKFSEAQSIQLHIFADASQDAYATVGYFRVQYKDHIEVALVSAKARVAPIKYLSIPRLELEASLLASRLGKDILQKHTVKIDKVYLWTDSKTVLCWLRSDHRKYRPYVAHRVGEMLDNFPIKHWRWVPTGINVADDATKWTKTPTFEMTDRWFRGPDFLYKDELAWPEDVTPQLSTSEEMKVTLFHSPIDVQKPALFDDSRFSSWEKLVRVAAYVIRFVENVRKPVDERNMGIIIQGEFEIAEDYLFQQAQLEGYPSEFAKLKRTGGGDTFSKAIVPKTSQIYKDFPYLDENDVIRAHGRIDKANAPYQMKRPILLPTNCRITELIIFYYHKKYHHMNNEIIVNEVRQRFVIPKLRPALHRIVKQCNRCKIRMSLPSPPLMSELPLSRLATFTRPFTMVGID